VFGSETKLGEETMSDHLDSPGPVTITVGDDSASVGPPLGDAKTDITDLYAFLKPDDDGASEPPGKSILMLNVNPLAPALASEFESGAEYLIRVDTNKDAVEDITFRVTFSAKTMSGQQTARVERIDSAGAIVVIPQAEVSFGPDAQVTVNGPYKFFAGLRSDPFFFDLLGFIDDFNFVHGDFFADKNVFAIVLEVPNRALGTTPATTSLWGRTRVNPGGGLINDDRVGRAAINTVFNHGVDKNIFNGLEPSQDTSALNNEGVTFVKSFASTLTALGGNPALANVLLPDVLNYDYTKPTDYAKLNGRRLRDDVISISLSLVTNGALTTDNVGPHTDYLDRFPYAGKPH
jgi:uncharacterized protein DUF4331